MKALLMISNKPKWVELILNFIKKDEIRKGTAIGKAINRLIEEQGVAPMLIYCTKDNKQKLCYVPATETFYCYSKDNIVAKQCDRMGLTFNGKVVARFNATAEHIEYETCSRDISGWWKDDGKMYDHKDACLTYKEMFDYVGAGEGTVIHINDLEIFNRPKEISEFKVYCEEDFCHCYYGKCKECAHLVYEDENYCDKRLTRAPQSWCYVEA